MHLVNRVIFAGICFGVLIGCSFSSPLRFPASEPLEAEAELFQEGLDDFQKRLEARKPTISHERHYPKILHHGKRTEYVVVFTHGLFESPSFLQSLAQNFYDRDMNVVLPLLPGHWAQPPVDIKKATHKQWIEEHNANIEIAKKLGSKIILAGYSTGGELAIEAVLSQKTPISALILWAPALGLHMQTAAGSEFGSILGIDGNGHRGIPMADGYDVPYYAPQAGLAVFSLIKYVFHTYRPAPARNGDELFYVVQYRKELYARIKMPTLVIGSNIDDIVSKEEIQLFYQNLGGEKDGLFFDDVGHRDLAKSKADAYHWRPEGYNKHFDEMVKKINGFLDQRNLGKPIAKPKN